MKHLKHQSAKESHYDSQAAHYDALNKEHSKLMNRAIGKILKKHKVKTVLDMTCGTGSQVFWLAKHGFDVVGSDISAKMLAVAKSKAKSEKRAIKFIKGDMRSSKHGSFDAVVTIFNAVGHLTTEDFEKAMQNIRRNLNDGGLYIFDINNLSFLTKGDNITKLTIDWQKLDGDTKVRKIQYSTIDDAGILASYTTSLVQNGKGVPKISEGAQTLQVYTAKQLREMLERNGFSVIGQHSTDGSKFVEKKSECILTIAKAV